MTPEHWKRTELSAVVSLRRGFDLPEPRRRRGSVPILGSFGVTGWHDEARAPGPGVTVGRSGASIGVVSYSPVDFWPLNTVLYADGFLGNDERFVYWLLKGIDFASFNSGSAQPSLNRNYIARIPVWVPPIEEQRRIAGVLGALDDKIEHNRVMAGRLERFADLQFLTMFAVEHGARLPLGRIVSRVKALVQPLDRSADVFEHFSIPAFDDARLPSLDVGASMLSVKTVVPNEDCVLLSKLNPGTPRVWWPRPTGERPAVCSSEFMVLTPSVNTPTSFVYASLRADWVLYDEILGHATGTTGSRQRVKPSDILGCMALSASDSELGAWDELARPLYDLAARRISESARLVAIRDALLPRLVSGALPVPQAYQPGKLESAA